MENKFKDRLALARKSLELSQDELAKRCDTSLYVISTYERGKRKPGLDMIIKLSRALDCSSDYLIGLERVL